MGHGARGDEDEEGAEGKGEGAVAARKLQDSIGRGKKRGEEERDSSGGVLFLEFFPHFLFILYIFSGRKMSKYRRILFPFFLLK